MDTTSGQADKLLLSIAETGRRLSLGRSSVYLLINGGELPTVRRGRAVRIPASAIEDWVRRQTAGNGKDAA